MNDLEQKAMALRNNRSSLLRRLKSAASFYGGNYWKDATFDFENARLIHPDGKHCLQWRLRHFPEQPESYLNQQTSIGAVAVWVV